MHHHHHGHRRLESDQPDPFIDYLSQFDRIFEPLHRQIIAWLSVPRASQVLDAGCGAGGVTRLLAETVAEPNRVTALDIEPDMLAAAKVHLSTTPYAVHFREGSLDNLPFGDGEFDLIWCSRTLHHASDQLTAARELRRVLKSGGRLALREDGVSMRLLPFDVGLGQAGLDERLNVVRAWEFAQVHPSLPNAVPYPFGWTHLLREAGFTQMTARSFIFEALPPFDADLSAFVLRHWGHLLEEGDNRARLSHDDQRVLEQLLDQNSPHFMLNRDDLYFVKVSTVYVGYT